MPRYYTIITDKGVQKEIAAKISGDLVRLTHIAIGDAEEYELDTAQTELKHEVYRIPITRTYRDTANTNSVCIEGILPESVGGFYIREAGIYDDDGDLFAIAKYPETYKPVFDDGSTKDLYIRFVLFFSNVPAVQLHVNPSISVPSIDAINALLEEELSKLKGLINQDFNVFSGKLGTLEDLFVSIVFPAPVASLPGFLKCDGSLVSRTDYSKLFSRIGTTFGEGDGENTFAIPDYRGCFLRGLGGNSEADFATLQGDAMREIWGWFRSFDRANGGVDGAFSIPNRWSSGVASGGGDSWGTNVHFSASRYVPTAAEFRPINQAVNWFIKY